MREIKFRGIYPYWKNEDLKNGWVIGYLGFDGDDDEYCIQSREQETGIDGYGEGYQVIKETIGQYTGLKDKNGVDLYEGDIFKDCEGYVWQVVWNRQGLEAVGSFHQSYQGESYVNTSYNHLGNNTHDKRWGITIIGNIYENPDLLEVN